MRFARFITVFIGLTASLVLVACNRDPNVKKQRYFQSGKSYFEKGKYRESAIQFSNAIQVDPKFTEAHYELAQSYLHEQYWSNAYRELQRTVDLDPNNLKAQLDLCSLLIAARSDEEARAQIDKLLQRNPTNADAHMLLATLYLVEQARDAASQEAQKAIALDPSRPKYYVELASLEGAGQREAAEANLKKALELDPKFGPALEALSLLCQQTGRPAEAEKLLQETIELEPKALLPRQYLARLDYAQNRKADAEQVMVRAKKDLASEGLYRVLGDYYVSIGDINKATAEFESLAKEYPKDLTVRESYIEILLSNNKVDEASNLNDAILKEKPRETSALFIRGRILNVKGKYNDAVNTLRTALRDAPDNALGHYELGVALSRTGNLGGAEQEWREAAKLAPQINEVQLVLAQLALAKGDHDLLRQSAEQLLKNSPGDPRGYILRARAETFANQTAAAEADIKQAIAVAPQNALGYAAMGGWMVNRGKLNEAQNYFEKALDDNPNEFDALEGLVAILAQQKQTAQAVARVEQQIAKSPNNDTYYTLLAGLQANNKDWVEAGASLQKAISLNKTNLTAFTLLSKVEMSQGLSDQALATSYRAIDENPNAVTGYVLAATLEDGRGNWQKAEKLYQQALQVEPNYAVAANNLAYGMLEHGENTDLALSLAQVARQKMPDSSDTADTLAWAYYHKAVYGLAADLLKEAVEKTPDNALFQYHLGMVYGKNNNRAEAKAHLERSLKIAPNSPEASEIRKILGQIG